MDYINQQILNYKITRLLGKGGMASVYEAVHPTLNSKVAVKILNPILMVSKQIKVRFLNEARIMVNLKHPNIVRVENFEERKNMLAIVMEMLEGVSLHTYIQQKGSLTPDEAKRIMLPVLSALGYAHEQGIVHRDIKPSNIFIQTDGTPKILDFGIAKLISSVDELTNTGVQMGTLTYMSPEQVKDSKHIDYRTDIYSLAVSFYYMLTGKKAYDTSTLNDFDIREAIVRKDFPKLTRHTEYQDIIERATKKDPNKRYQYCSEMLEAIKNISNVKPPESNDNNSKEEKEETKEEEKEKEEEYVVNEVTPVKEVITEQAHVKEQKDTLVETSDTKKETLVDKTNITNKNEVEKTNPNVKKQQAKPVNKQKNKNIKSKSPRLKLYMNISAVILVMAAVLFFILSDKPSKSSKPKYPKMVFIKGGTFQMGSNKYNDEKPIHSVRVSDFYIGKYEVTFAQYDAFCEATNRKKPDDEGWGRGNRPVINVSWNDAVAYCKWLSQKTGYEYRLPTEAEWEYAAGGGSTHQKWAGTDNESLLRSYAWYGANSNGKTHPIGGKQPNKLGLHDMSGNVWEWCSDWYSGYYYSKGPSSNPQGPKSGSFRVYRGGSWNDYATNCHVPYCNYYTPTHRSYDLGFRVVHR